MNYVYNAFAPYFLLILIVTAMEKSEIKDDPLQDIFTSLAKGKIDVESLRMVASFNQAPSWKFSRLNSGDECGGLGIILSKKGWECKNEEQLEEAEARSLVAHCSDNNFARISYDLTCMITQEPFNVDDQSSGLEVKRDNALQIRWLSHLHKTLEFLQNHFSKAMKVNASSEHVPLPHSRSFLVQNVVDYILLPDPTRQQSKWLPFTEKWERSTTQEPSTYPDASTEDYFEEWTEIASLKEEENNGGESIDYKTKYKWTLGAFIALSTLVGAFVLIFCIRIRNRRRLDFHVQSSLENKEVSSLMQDGSPSEILIRKPPGGLTPSLVRVDPLDCEVAPKISPSPRTPSQIFRDQKTISSNALPRPDSTTMLNQSMAFKIKLSEIN